MRSDCASIPTRGSRLVGLLSIIITRVLGLGACEQESRVNTKPPSSPKRIIILKKIVILSEAKDLLLARARPAALRIRDLSQDRRPLRSRSRRHIAWPPMPRLMRQQGKSHCLLRFRRKAEFIREMQFEPQGCDFIPQHGHQRRILRASARDNHLVIAASSAESRQHEALDCVRNRSRRQRRCRRHHVSLTGAAADPKKSAHVFPAKFLAPRRSRRLLPKKGRAHQPCNHLIQYASRRRDATITIEAFSEKFFHHRI